MFLFFNICDCRFPCITNLLHYFTIFKIFNYFVKCHSFMSMRFNLKDREFLSFSLKEVEKNKIEKKKKKKFIVDNKCFQLLGRHFISAAEKKCSIKSDIRAFNRIPIRLFSVTSIIQTSYQFFFFFFYLSFNV